MDEIRTLEFYKNWSYGREYQDDEGSMEYFDDVFNENITFLQTQEELLQKDDIIAGPSLKGSRENIPVDEDVSLESLYACLAVLKLSDSQMKLNNLAATYTVPEDPGLVPAFWILYPRLPPYSEDGVQKFKDLVKSMKIQPVSCIAKMMTTDTINLRYYQINPEVIRPLCEALQNNQFVEVLDLQDNVLSTDACYHLNQLLLQNTPLKTLRFANCRIGYEGMKRFRVGIANAENLLELDLQGCDLRDEGFEAIVDSFIKSPSLESLNLANNGFTAGCMEALANLISGSELLKSLNLSWNALFSGKLWKGITPALARNAALQSLNLAWNALGKECSAFISEILGKNQGIKILNVQGNRFTEADAVDLGKGLSKNTNLEEIYLGNNPLGPKGVNEILHGIFPNGATPGTMLDTISNLKIVDMDNIWANKSILPLLEKVKNERPSMNIKLGGILSNFKLIGPDARKIFLKRANFEAMKPKKKKDRKDFGHFVLTLGDEVVTKERFHGLIKDFKLNLSESLISEIMRAFEVSKDTVDQGALKAFYLLEYPDTKLPPPSRLKQKKEKKTKGKKTKGKKQEGKSKKGTKPKGKKDKRGKRGAGDSQEIQAEDEKQKRVRIFTEEQSDMGIYGVEPEGEEEEARYEYEGEGIEAEQEIQEDDYYENREEEEMQEEEGIDAEREIREDDYESMEEEEVEERSKEGIIN